MNSQKFNWPKEAASKGLHNSVLEIVQEVLSNCELHSPVKALDIPSGSGHLTKLLQDQLGIDCIPADIELNETFLADRRIFVKANCNSTLPFKDGEFNLFISVEGIEHFENPSFFFREAARVLQPGGVGIVTTPNVDSYLSRVNILFKGYPRHFSPKSPQTKDSGHLLPCDLIFMRGAICSAGLKIKQIRAHQGKNKPTLRSKFFRHFVAKKWPFGLGETVPFYGENLIYVFEKS